MTRRRIYRVGIEWSLRPLTLLITPNGAGMVVNKRELEESGATWMADGAPSNLCAHLLLNLIDEVTSQ